MDERFKRENIKPIADKGRLWNDEFVIRIDNIAEEADVFKTLRENDACKRIVVENGYIMGRHGKRIFHCNLVIEPKCDSEHVNEIYFNLIKRKMDKTFKEYIQSEMTDEVVDNYLDKEVFYKFPKPYLLSADSCYVTKRNVRGTFDWDISKERYIKVDYYSIVGVYVLSRPFYWPEKYICEK